MSTRTLLVSSITAVLCTICLLSIAVEWNGYYSFHGHIFESIRKQSTLTEKLDILPECPYTVSGPFNHGFTMGGFLNRINTTIFSENFSNVDMGGKWTPKDCKPVHDEIVVIVPIRGRKQHLKIFLSLIHPLLQIQRIPYTIMTVEQPVEQELNKGFLFNIGVLNASDSINCFILADVDMIPDRLENMFTCDKTAPKSLLTGASYIGNYYPVGAFNNFGGTVAFTREQYYKVNGFSTFFWGWGEEDNDMSRRVRYFYGRISRVPYNVGLMTHLDHSRNESGTIKTERFLKIRAAQYDYNKDGLRNTMDYCRITHVNYLPLRTALSVECVRPPDSVIEKALNITF